VLTNIKDDNGGNIRTHTRAQRFAVSKCRLCAIIHENWQSENKRTHISALSKSKLLHQSANAATGKSNTKRYMLENQARRTSSMTVVPWLASNFNGVCARDKVTQKNPIWLNTEKAPTSYGEK